MTSKIFKLTKEFRYSGEGWGLTNDGKHLFLSAGTHVIRVIDPETFKVVRTIAVMNEDGKPLMRLNELEYVKGEIWGKRLAIKINRKTKSYSPNFSRKWQTSRLDKPR